MAKKQGSLVCVGPGVTLGAHMSERCRNHIEAADVVFTNCHPIMESWIGTMNKDVRSLQSLYKEGKDRRETYREMSALILAEVRREKRVVGAFYGHPGVFAQVPHHAIAVARQEGYQAHMEPGISAEDCLYADMGIDPGAYGCQHFEASQFMVYERNIDPSAYLFLWQIGLAGDLSISKRGTGARHREVLVALLKAHYPAEHRVALYECPTLITDSTRIDWLQLKDLPSAEINLVSTLVIPPSASLKKNETVINQLRQLENAKERKDENNPTS